MRAVGKTLDPGTANSEEREEAFKTLREGFAQKEDPNAQHLAKVMESFRRGLFAGGDGLDLPEGKAKSTILEEAEAIRETNIKV